MGRAGSYCCGFDSCKTSEESFRELRHELDRRLDNRQRTAARLARHFVALRRFGRVVHQIGVMEVTTLTPLVHQRPFSIARDDASAGVVFAWTVSYRDHRL